MSARLFPNNPCARVLHLCYGTARQSRHSPESDFLQDFLVPGYLVPTPVEMGDELQRTSRASYRAEDSHPVLFMGNEDVQNTCVSYFQLCFIPV